MKYNSGIIYWPFCLCDWKYLPQCCKHNCCLFSLNRGGERSQQSVLSLFDNIHTSSMVRSRWVKAIPWEPNLWPPASQHSPGAVEGALLSTPCGGSLLLYVLGSLVSSNQKCSSQCTVERYCCGRVQPVSAAAGHRVSGKHPLKQRKEAPKSVWLSFKALTL